MMKTDTLPTAKLSFSSDIDQIVVAGREAKEFSLTRFPAGQLDDEKEKQFTKTLTTFSGEMDHLLEQTNEALNNLNSTHLEQTLISEMNHLTLMMKFMQDILKTPNKNNLTTFHNVYHQKSARNLVYTLLGLLERETTSSSKQEEVSHKFSDLMRISFRILTCCEAFASGLFGNEHIEELSQLLERVRDFELTLTRWSKATAHPTGIFGPDTRWADIVIENHTASYFNFKVCHQFTGNPAEESEWKSVAPNERKFMMDVKYFTGIFAPGLDNFKVFGDELYEVFPEKPIPITHNGKYFTEGQKWRIVGYDYWKVHTDTVGRGERHRHQSL